jgi:ABC-type nitrate/sulfonate/bicarbonate transport system permease component
MAPRTAAARGHHPQGTIARRLLGSAAAQRAFIPLLVLALWTFVTETGLVRPLFLPSPLDIVAAFGNLAPRLLPATTTSMTMILAGFMLGSLSGILFGLAMAYDRVVLNAFGTIFDFLRPVPIFALIPLFVLWFGIGLAPQIALIAFGCLVILGVTTTEAIRNMPRIYVQASYTLGAKRNDVFRTVVVPYIVPHLIGSIRVAAAASFGLNVAAEFMGSQAGLGYLLIVQQQYLRTDGILAIVILYSVLAFLLDRVIALIEKQLTGWTERRAAKAVMGL